MKEIGMKSTSAIISALLAVTQACWMIEPAQAQPGEHGKPDKAQKPHKPNKAPHSQGAQHPQHHGDTGMPGHEAMHKSDYNGPVPIGGYFQERHREAAQIYYGRPENRGYCPPGLDKKSADCLPPGQARKWQRGRPLPAGVVYYEVPRSVVLTLGVPPPGYRYVRVASDILLLAVGTGMVVDAIEDLVH
jgi:Ni/Co efflux regulator RcnB